MGTAAGTSFHASTDRTNKSAVRLIANAAAALLIIGESSIKTPFTESSVSTVRGNGEKEILLT